MSSVAGGSALIHEASAVKSRLRVALSLPVLYRISHARFSSSVSGRPTSEIATHISEAHAMSRSVQITVPILSPILWLHARMEWAAARPNSADISLYKPSSLVRNVLEQSAPTVFPGVGSEILLCLYLPGTFALLVFCMILCRGLLRLCWPRCEGRHLQQRL